MGGLIVGVALIVVGISALTGISLFNFFVAFILIALGIRMLVRRSPGRWHPDIKNSVSSGDRINEVAVFSPLNKKIASEHFEGGRIVAVFSSAEIDLTEVKTDKSEIDLELSSVFSSIEITIPKDWKVRSNAAMFLGSVDTHQAQNGEGSVTLVIRGDAVFGEIEVRN